MAVPAHHLFEARLVNGDAARIERVDLRLVLIHTDDVVSVLSETGPEHEADIPCSDDGDFHFTIRY